MLINPSIKRLLLAVHKSKIYAGLIGALLFSQFMLAVASADIRLPKIFSDHMVLQRNANVTIWGKAEPQQSLTIRLGDEEISTTADAEGNWTAVVRTGDAGGPHQLEVAAAKKGEPKIVLSDVMFGEVWLCSGQSNMEWPMTRIDRSEQEIQTAQNYANIRLFTVGHDASSIPVDDFAKVDSWRTCSPETVKDFSAVAYFFARRLSDEMQQIPIGLIDSSWGGTPAEAWTSRSTLEQLESVRPLLANWAERNDHRNPHNPSVLFQGMIHPLIQFKLRGVIWYQGESNNGRGAQYSDLFPALIADWRSHFKAPEMPFYFVQLAPFRYGNRSPLALPEVWDAQLKTLKNVPHTGMVVTTDITELNDIHPKNKQDVGARLACIALAKIYLPTPSKESPSDFYSGPIFRDFTVEGSKIRVDFDYAGEKLQIRAGEETLTEFQIAAADGEFVPANAMIEGNQVLVWSDQVDQPVAVRFGWSDTAQPNLINSAGLPASPFRTDDFPLGSHGVYF